MEEFKFNTVEEAIAAIKAGKMVLVTDDEDRENEGDLIMAAELCTPEAVNFMAKYDPWINAKFIPDRRMY